jgi:hypothetical protein
MLNGLISHRTIGLIVGPIDVLAIVGSTIAIYLPAFSDENKRRIFARPTMPFVIVSSLEYGPGAAKRLSLIR